MMGSFHRSSNRWRHVGLLTLTSAVALAWATRPLAGDDETSRARDAVSFNRDVRPILADKCFACHGPDANRREADLRFDDAASATADRDGGPAIAAGKPESSSLIARITADDPAERMPPEESGKPLTRAEIELLRRWVVEGAEYEAHWSYLPPVRPAVPAVKQTDWPANDGDRFILARLESEGVAPSPDADRVTLIRRLSFDLIGLPPTPDEVAAFVADERADAYERLVDRLLESRHYGERMSMHWLDLVRYADTVGYHGDQEHPITPYRDWVIQAFNDNLPFDRFTTEQLAGDLLPDATVDQRIASGYNRLLQTSHEGGVQVKEYLTKYDADRVRNFAAVWLGATIGCAQCHDHKYDPYTMRDFYSLAAFFADVDDMRTFKGGDTTPTKREPEIVVLSPIDRRQIEAWEKEVRELEEKLADPTIDRPDDARRLDELRSLIDDRRKATRRTMVTESVAPRTIRILPRGDWLDESGEAVEPAVPHFLPTFDEPTSQNVHLGADANRAAGIDAEANQDAALGDETPSNNRAARRTRLDLARWLTHPDHPQTSRVFVNRLWRMLFGAGLCRTLDDTGSQGEWPTHPELLDYLACEFAADWNVKLAVKRIVMSRAYRQSSAERADLVERDPANRLFARQARFRLPAEMVRDNALAVSGLLVDRIGGPSARPYQPAGYYAPLNFPKREYQADNDSNQYRRGVYMHWQRQFLHPMLRAFDAPSREECTADRPVSNTPLAALTLLNDPTFVEAARVFAAGAIGGHDETISDDARLRWMWRRTLSREPSSAEIESLKSLVEFARRAYRDDPAAAGELQKVGLAAAPDGIDPIELAAWTQAARALLNLSETITRN